MSPQVPRTKNSITAEVRRAWVRKGLAQCLRPKQIHQLLLENNIQCSEKTVDRDVAAVREEVRKSLKADANPLENTLSDYEIKYDYLLREAWNLYNTSNNESTKAKLVRSIGDLLAQRIKIFQSLGIVHESQQSSREITIKWIRDVRDGKENIIKSSALA